MTIEITVPELGESITEATVAKWFKKVGDPIAVDETLLELETDKVTLEVPAPSAGVLQEILVIDGTNVEVGAILGSIAEGAAPEAKTPAALEPPVSAAPEPPAPRWRALAPSVRKLIDDNNLDPAAIPATGDRKSVV